jgi:hypothetical protein
LCAIGQETAVKIHHAEKTLQLFDFLRGWADFSISAVWLAMGAAPATEIVCPRISKEDAAKTHFSRFMARQLVARAERKASRWPVLCIRIQPDPKLFAS